MKICRGARGLGGGVAASCPRPAGGAARVAPVSGTFATGFFAKASWVPIFTSPRATTRGFFLTPPTSPLRGSTTRPTCQSRPTKYRSPLCSSPGGISLAGRGRRRRRPFGECFRRSRRDPTPINSRHPASPRSLRRRRSSTLGRGGGGHGGGHGGRNRWFLRYHFGANRRPTLYQRRRPRHAPSARDPSRGAGPRRRNAPHVGRSVYVWAGVGSGGGGRASASRGRPLGPRLAAPHTLARWRPRPVSHAGPRRRRRRLARRGPRACPRPRHDPTLDGHSGLPTRAEGGKPQGDPGWGRGPQGRDGTGRGRRVATLRAQSPVDGARAGNRRRVDGVPPPAPPRPAPCRPPLPRASASVFGLTSEAPL